MEGCTPLSVFTGYAGRGKCTLPSVLYYQRIGENHFIKGVL